VSPPKTENKDRKLVATNRRARFDYEIVDTFEAGLALLGPEVKSLRGGKASLAEAFAIVRRGEAWLVGCHIPPYEQAGRENPDPLRERKLLLHKREIAELEGSASERGFTVIPLELYFKDGRAKVSVAIARGKKRHDKRETIRRREEEREVARTMRRGRR
jgi:SsrA-binding protein